MSKTAQDLKEPSGAKPSDGQFNFQAEVARLLHLMVHSVYSEKEIFLRELISNAADACDKLRYEAAMDPNLLAGDPDLRITLSVDKVTGVLTVADNGIGMNREEMIDNLGTIARSGTRAFLDNVYDGEAPPSLIGQFGVGFYSAFMVADRVDVISCRAGAKEACLWSSDGHGGFTVETLEDAGALTRGTEVHLHLKQDAKAFLDEPELERIVRAYSDHISFPINLVRYVDDKQELRQLNTANALWTRPKAELDADSYREFYHHVAGAFDEPALTIHYKAEGRHEYTVLLFVPSMRPFDLYDPSRKGRVRLYVRRVFITEEADILPSYLRFVRGIIDSDDMPLNISREMLQNNPIVVSIRKAVSKRVLSEIAKCADSAPEKFETLWTAFGAVLKEGLYEDPERRDQLFALARFRTSRGPEWRSLKEYVADLRPNQTAIYYIVGESQEQLRASPQLEGFRAHGVEVLLLSDPVDNFWVTTALGFDGQPFQSITQGDADLSNMPLLDEAEKEAEEAGEQDAGVAAVELLGRLKALLSDAVGDVRYSTRLVESPACLVAPTGGPDRGLDKLLDRQSGGAGQRPVLEINRRHRLVTALQETVAKDKQRFEDVAWLLLDEARILDGDLPADPAKFSERVNRLVLAASDSASSRKVRRRRRRRRASRKK